ncbi:SoxR reducing system RseC family protein [Vallitalea okinawensis]|uniref:SoxR reducing system RseC family protein n=1 Tax=Vallitalea okinawensis TaxID=2078660 RepID=UPI000CFAEE3A|nr:SoxR reducing system RseC family protein [Vallitalea okinawensis]
MAEIGLVKEIQGDEVIVSLNRQEACNKCRACIQGMQEQEMILKAQNLCHASVGDQVEVTLEESNFLKAVAIMYGIPFIALMIGLISGYYISGIVTGTQSEGIALLSGFILLALSYLGIRKNESKFKTSKYKPVAVKIVK